MKHITDQRCDILVTCGRFAYQQVRSFAKAGFNVWVTDTKRFPIFYSKYLSGSFISPNYETDEKSYIQSLLQFVDKYRPRIIVPLFDFLLLSKYRDEFPPSTIIATESLDILETLDNKGLLLNYASLLSVPMPKIYHDASAIAKYPVVFKVVRGRSGDGVFFVNSKEELSRLMEIYKDTPFLITEFIDGEDCCVDCIKTDTYTLCSCYMTIRDDNKNAFARKTCKCPPMVEYAKRILNALNYKGICGFDFMISGEKIYLLEANPRYTGGLGTQIASGFDIPLYHVSSLLNKEILIKDTKDNFVSQSFERNLMIAYKEIKTGTATWRKVNELISWPLKQYEDYDEEDKMVFLNQLLHNKRRVLTVLIYKLFGLSLVL